jgi:chaperonin GroES
MKVRPLQDRVVVKPLTNENKTAGGIIIPDNAQEKPVEGEIIAVGNGRALKDGKVVKPELKVGDRVLYSKYAGNEFKISGQDHLIMREEDVLAVLEK